MPYLPATGTFCASQTFSLQEDDDVCFVTSTQSDLSRVWRVRSPGRAAVRGAQRNCPVGHRNGQRPCAMGLVHPGYSVAADARRATPARYRSTWVADYARCAGDPWPAPDPGADEWLAGRRG